MGYAIDMKRVAVCLSLMLWPVLGLAGCLHGAPLPGKYVDRVVECTAYCPCKKCCGWKRTWYGKAVVASGRNAGQPKQVGITASGTKAKKGTIAADLSKYPFGTRMYIPGYGYGTVEDRGSAILGEHIDLFYKHHRQAAQWGRRRLKIRIWVAQ
jgi:3D (Asp-Asp-Asp) domain-containing protein